MKSGLKLPPLEIPYTICFCISSGKILMLHRKKHPNKNLWNGIGGKLEPGEDPFESVSREMKEESDLDAKLASAFEFRGLVTWFWSLEDGSIFYKGMYVFVAQFGKKHQFNPKDTAEGYLEWKDLNWAVDKNNNEVVSNIPRFLPKLLKQKKLKEHRCFYIADQLVEITSYPLPKDLKI